MTICNVCGEHVGHGSKKGGTICNECLSAASDTTNPIKIILDQSGWVIELEKSVWLLAADADPSRTLVLKNATRWPTERSARRAISRVRKRCRHKFHGATIYHVD